MRKVKVLPRFRDMEDMSLLLGNITGIGFLDKERLNWTRPKAENRQEPCI